MATIYDIAKRCNCSTTTVSKVLNGYGNISLAKKEEILTVAKELDYIRNVTALSLARNSSHLIGVLLHINEDKSITHELFSNLLNDFRKEMEKHDYDICFIRNTETVDECCSLIKARNFDGV